MANIYEALSCSSSTSPAEADDISVFLRQILLRSSSSSSTLMSEKVNEVQCLTTSNGLLQNQQCPVQFVSGSDWMSSLSQSSSGLNSGAYFPMTAPNVSSSSVGTVDNDIEEYECESEEGLLEEAPAKAAASRSSSKRGRAAEVHNLSEKRRRCRINEKMKALQNLIPNSNKTDKASMLDEAIEYLKQLQLQVQMLTMRNGLSLYPMCPPGAVNPYQLPRMKMAFNEGNGSLNMSKAAALPVDQDVLPNTLLSLPDHYTIAKQTSVTNNLSVIDSTTSFGIQSSHVGSFQLPGLSKGICGEGSLSFQRINEDHSSTSMLDYHIGNADTDMKEINTLQACLLGRYQSENSRLEDLGREAVMLPQMDGMSIGRSALIKSESSYF